MLGENVAGIINMALDDVLSDLERIGYATQALVIPACAVDARHRRDRCWIVARHNDRVGSPQVRKICCGKGSDSIGVCEDVADAGLLGQAKCKEQTARLEQCGENVPHALGVHDDRGGHGTSEICGKRPKASELSGSEDVSNATRKLQYRDGSPRDGGAKSSNGGGWATFPGLGRVVARLPNGLDGYWPDEPQDIPRTAKGIANRTNRLKALGNAIVPQVAFQIFKAMVEC